MTPDTDHIPKLALIIREVDGGNRLGAAALAEAILSHPGSRWSPATQPEPEELTDEELLAVLTQAVASFPPMHPEAKALSAVEYDWELEARKARAVIAADRARAYLAQPEPEYPSDKELLKLMPETMRDEFSYAAKVCSDATGGQVKPRIFRVALNTAALEYAQAILAHYTF